jgi:hypothetical protein
VNLTGFDIQCATVSRFDLSRLRPVFARALPDFRLYPVQNRRTDPENGSAPTKRISADHAHRTIGFAGAETQKAGVEDTVCLRYARVTKIAPGSIENQEDETQKWGVYGCTFA